MKTCFIVHNAEAARALRSHVGPDARVVSPYARLNGFAIDRLIVVDAPALPWSAVAEWTRYEDWFREVIACRLTQGAVLINAPAFLRQPAT